MNTLILVLILALVVWFCFWILSQVSIPEPILTIVKVIIAALAIIKVLSIVGLGF